MALCVIMSLWNNETSLPQNFPYRSLDIPQELLIFTDSAYIDPDCNPIKVCQPYPHLTIAFDDPLEDFENREGSCFATLFFYRIFFSFAQSATSIFEEAIAALSSKSFTIFILGSNYFFRKTWRKHYCWN